MYRILLLLVALFATTEVHAQWREAVSDHFVIYAEGDEAWLRSYAEDLERFDKGVRRLRNLPDPKPGVNRVTIFLLSPATFNDLLGDRMIAGFYIPRERGSVAFMPRYESGLGPRVTLYHEYTHHIYSVAWAGLALPGWMSEGLAEFHSSAEFRSDGSMVFGREPAHREHSLSFLDNKEISRMLTTNTSASGDMIYYSGGWLLTHFLTFDRDRAEQMGQYLVAINSGNTLEGAATAAFGPLQELQRDLVRYRRRSTALPAVVVPASDLRIGAVRLRELTEGEAAAMPIRVRSEVGVSDDQAGQVYARAKAMAAPYPDNGMAQRVLAEAAYDAEDYEEAKAAARRAIAADPTLGAAHAYLALATMEGAEEWGDAARENWAEVRRIVENGLASDPDNAELLWLYYRTFAESGEGIPPIATQHLLQAYQIAPQSNALRMATVRQLLRDNRLDDARAVVRPLAYSVHSNPLVVRARKALENIEGGNRDAALTASEFTPREAADSPDEGGDGGE